MIGPLIVAVDTINKALGMQSKIFSNWLKEFAMIVFTQSLQAMFLLLVLKIIKGVNDKDNGGYMVGIVSMMLTAALVKFEKTFKSIFGIRSTMLGEVKGGAMKMFSSMQSLGKAGSAVGDNVKKMDEASKKKKSAQQERVAAQNRLRRKTELYNALAADGSSGSSGASGQPDSSRSQGALFSPDGFGEKGSMSSGTFDLSDAQLPETLNLAEGSGEKQFLEEIEKETTSSSGFGPAMQTDAIVRAINTVGSEVRKIASSEKTKSAAIKDGVAKDSQKPLSELAKTKKRHKMEELSEGIEQDRQAVMDADKKIAEAQSEYSSARLAKIFGGANVIAGLGIGLGAEGNFHEAMQLGGYVTTGLDYGAEKLGYQGARNVRKAMYEKSKDEGFENEAILQPKSKLVINPVKQTQQLYESSLEIKNMVQGTFTQEMSQAMLGEIGKTVREEMKKSKSENPSRIKAEIADSFKGFKNIHSTQKRFKESYRAMGANNNNSIENSN